LLIWDLGTGRFKILLRTFNFSPPTPRLDKKKLDISNPYTKAG